MMKWLLLAVVMGGAPLVHAEDAAAEAGALERFLEEFARNREGIHSLTADFAQENLIEDEPFISHGTVTYAKPKRILFRYEDTGRAFVIDHRTMYDYDPDVEQVMVQQLEDKPEVEALFLGFSEDFTQVREVYTMGFFETGDATTGLELSPKPSAHGDAEFVRARLWLRPRDFLPTRVEVQVTHDSKNTYYLSAYELHETLSAAQVHVTVPAGTIIVADDSIEELTEARRIPFADSHRAAPDE
jgi:outer membrane lipoprotein-sorting protein